MRSVVQRVVRGSVTVEGKLINEIGRGLVVLLGVGQGDTVRDAVYLAEKIAHLRLFEDSDGKMNLSVLETGGGSAGSVSIHPLRRLPQGEAAGFFTSLTA